MYLTGLVEVLGVFGSRQGADNWFLKDVCSFDGAFQVHARMSRGARRRTSSVRFQPQLRRKLRGPEDPRPVVGRGVRKGTRGLRRGSRPRDRLETSCAPAYKGGLPERGALVTAKPVTHGLR